jgi:hypothetical protein
VKPPSDLHIGSACFEAFLYGTLISVGLGWAAKRDSYNGTLPLLGDGDGAITAHIRSGYDPLIGPALAAGHVQRAPDRYGFRVSKGIHRMAVAIVSHS